MPRDEGVVEDHFGVRIPDPYRALEEPDSAATREFVDAQIALTEGVLEQCETRGQFKTLLTELWDYEKFGCPARQGARYVYSYNRRVAGRGGAGQRCSTHRAPADACAPPTPPTLPPGVNGTQRPAQPVQVLQHGVPGRRAAPAHRPQRLVGCEGGRARAARTHARPLRAPHHVAWVDPPTQRPAEDGTVALAGSAFSEDVPVWVHAQQRRL